MLRSFPGAEGMKTGYIRASGYNLITTAKRNGHRLIGVIFGGNTARARDRHMKKLLNKAYNKVSAEKLTHVVNRIKNTNKNNLYSRTKRNRVSNESIWGIQVGAFYRRKPAVALVKKLFSKHMNLFSEGQITIMPLQKSGDRTLYRARILGIPMKSAYKACRILKRHRQACMPLRLPGNVQLASL